MLLVDALKRTLAVSDEIAIYALVVDPIDEQAQGFYEQFGFSLLGSESRRLFLPLQSALTVT
jgi:ribosomal protein S18 acetylase RimI-like enzyme